MELPECEQDRTGGGHDRFANCEAEECPVSRRQEPVGPPRPPVSEEDFAAAARLLQDADALLADVAAYDEAAKHGVLRCTGESRQGILSAMQTFVNSAWAMDKARSSYLSAQVYPRAVSQFRKLLMRSASQELAQAIAKLADASIGAASPQPVVTHLFPLFSRFCARFFAEEVTSFRALVESADMSRPHLWFPLARAVRRHIIYHAGPTNSGKTYEALCALKEARSGVYLGPLRLLAMEVFDKLNAEGVYCGLQTGQEKFDVPFARHMSCTIETASVDRIMDVAVIDEIQMMADPQRGSAWTRALLGVPADVVHVCGDASVVELVRKLAATCGDTFQLRTYKRFSPLMLARRSLGGDFSLIRPGDCVVAFSRRDIFAIKKEVEAATGIRSCVVYGALPPEVRREQANLFNAPGNGFDVLVASDAIGMGLNLNIRRVIFHSLRKHNGRAVGDVPPSMVRQIAGRAGRRGTEFSQGVVAVMDPGDKDYLLECLQGTPEVAHAAGLFPQFEQLEAFAARLPPNVPYSQLLARFAAACVTEGSYFLGAMDSLMKVCRLLEAVPGLSLRDRYNLMLAPVNEREPLAMSAMLSYARMYGSGGLVRVGVGLPRGAGAGSALQDLEVKHAIVALYLWLSMRLNPLQFVEVPLAKEMLASVIDVLGDKLAHSSGQQLHEEFEASAASNRAKRGRAEGGAGNVGGAGATRPVKARVMAPSGGAKLRGDGGKLLDAVRSAYGGMGPSGSVAHGRDGTQVTGTLSLSGFSTGVGGRLGLKAKASDRGVQ
eukprot:jgi/Mesvir1/13255/Mv12234-RA.1